MTSGPSVGRRIAVAFARAVAIGVAGILAGWALADNHAFQLLLVPLVGFVGLRVAGTVNRARPVVLAYEGSSEGDRERWAVAYHEAGHRAVHHAATGWAPRARIYDGGGGKTSVSGWFTTTRMPVAEAAVVALAGPAAERRWRGSSDRGGWNDRRQARKWADIAGVRYSDVEREAERLVGACWSRISSDAAHLFKKGRIG